MKSIVLILLFLAVGFFLTNTLTHKKVAPEAPLKLSALTITQPQAQIKSKQILKSSPRRSTIEPYLTKQSDLSPELKAKIIKAPETEAEKIERAKIAWIKIRSKAMDRLRIDSHTREQIEDLKQFYKGDEITYNQKLREMIGDENMNFLYNVREEFKSRVMQKMNVEIGPQLGSL